MNLLGGTVVSDLDPSASSLITNYEYRRSCEIRCDGCAPCPIFATVTGTTSYTEAVGIVSGYQVTGTYNAVTNPVYDYTVKLGESAFVHAVLVVEAINHSGWDEFKALRNFNIYVGSSEDYQNNALCPGGPY